MSKFITADWHLGDDRFHLLRRPFNDVEIYIETLISNHNALVSPEDYVYVDGDVIYRNADYDKYLPYIARFNGKKILIRGNHDRGITNQQFAPYFEEIIPEGVGIVVNFDGLDCWVTHYPSLARKDMFNLVGHVHDTWRVQLNSFNVGIDVNHFTPVIESKITETKNAIHHFYDEDVWVAYDKANMGHLNLRGKKGSYFNLADMLLN